MIYNKNMTTIIRRESKYANLVRDCIKQLGHATHADIMQYYTDRYIQVSATTIHRITQRLVEDGEIALAPKTKNGDKRFDANMKPHDHFCCTRCDCLIDITCPALCRKILQDQLCNCVLDGSLTVYGECQECSCCRKEEHVDE